MPDQYLLKCHKIYILRTRTTWRHVSYLKSNLSSQLFQHYQKCGKFLCGECDYPFISVKDLDSHMLRCHRTIDGQSKKVYKCSICKHKCQNMKELYNNCMTQHGGNNFLYKISKYMEDLNIPEQAKYSINRQYILAADEDSDLKKVYNFPTNNLHRGLNKIRQLTQVYNDQQNAFRVNFSFGMILQNTETGEYGYFVSYFNTKILNFPFTLSNRNSIRFLKYKLARLNPR